MDELYLREREKVRTVSRERRSGQCQAVNLSDKQEEGCSFPHLHPANSYLNKKTPCKTKP